MEDDVEAAQALVGKAYTFGSPDLPAPQATLMKTVIDGVLSGSLPWGLVGTGATFSLSAMLAGLPGLAFAVGIYLPLGSLTPIFLGGLVRRIVEARRQEGPREGDPGVLAASGMIAGEGLAGVLIALAEAAREMKWFAIPESPHFADSEFTWISGLPGVILGLAVVAGIAALLYRAGLSAAPPSPVPVEAQGPGPSQRASLLGTVPEDLGTAPSHPGAVLPLGPYLSYVCEPARPPSRLEKDLIEPISGVNSALKAHGWPP